MKKKICYISILMFIVLIVILSINTNNKKYIEEKENKTLAVYIQNDNGSYSKTTNIPLKESGYTFSTSKSVCDGSATISWDNESWGLELDNIDRSNTKCYLYFDKN